MTAYNRPEYLAETLDSWDQVRGDYDLYIRCEPGSPGTVDVAHQHEAVVTVNKRKLGVLSNVWHEINDLMNDGVPQLIIAEDDVLVADDTVEMFQWAFDAYRDDQTVLGIIATQRWWMPEEGTEYQVRRGQHFAATVWGTWTDRWSGLLRDGWDHDYRHHGWDWWVADVLLRERGYLTLAPNFSRSQHIGLRGTHMRAKDFEDALCPTFRPHHEPGEWSEP